jgi:hypothetical protein
MPDDKLTFVNLGPHGTFEKSGKVNTTPADVDAIFAHLRTPGAPRKLTVHFHGGLVAEGGGMSVARKMAPVYRGGGAHPVTFVWETGFIETVVRNVQTIDQTKLFAKVREWVLKKASKHLGVGLDEKGVGQELTRQEIEQELRKAFPFDGLRVGVGARGARRLAAVDEAFLESELREELDEDLEEDAELRAVIEREAAEGGLLGPATPAGERAGTAKGFPSLASALVALVKIAVRVIRRFAQKRDHDFYPTVVEEILRELYIADMGAWIWGGMKSVAEDMWTPNAGLAGNALHGGRYFLDGLAALQRENGLQVDLVGHSAGSIAICQLLQVVREEYQDLRFRNVLLLAPAARSELFWQQIVKPRPRRPPGSPTLFDAVRVFTMSDTTEKKDRLVGPIYPRSLLYFISGVLERGYDVPLVGLERYLSRVAPYDAPELLDVAAYLNEPGTLVLSPSPDGAAEGFGSRSTSHGGFDDDEATRWSLSAIVRVP